jgi:hypothetical protein
MLGLVADDPLCSFVGGENQRDRRQADRVYSEANRSLLRFGQDLGGIVDDSPFEVRDCKEASDGDAGSNYHGGGECHNGKW